MRFGDFELLDRIGRGGMATVDRAILRRSNGFERQVAIKRILPAHSGSRAFIDMFINEARVSALLDHPNIVKVYDFGEVHGLYYLAMEYIEGVSLGELLACTPLSGPAAALVAHRVCAALDYAHTFSWCGRPLRLIHRDISPSNIMISTHGEVKVLDFGIAKALEAMELKESHAGGFKGKLSYSSPEQLQGLPITPRSDVFSLGVVLWEMLTGRRLFKRKSDGETVASVVRANVPRLTEWCADIAPELENVCRRAMAREAADRYPSAEAMAADLETLLAQDYVNPLQLAQMVKPLVATRQRQATAQCEPSYCAIDIDVGTASDVPDPRPRSLPRLASLSVALVGLLTLGGHAPFGQGMQTRSAGASHRTRGTAEHSPSAQVRVTRLVASTALRDSPPPVTRPGPLLATAEPLPVGSDPVQTQRSREPSTDRKAKRPRLRRRQQRAVAPAPLPDLQAGGLADPYAAGDRK